MKQNDIDKLTEQVLSIHEDPKKVHEFICALANAKAILENKINAEYFQASIKAGIQNMLTGFRGE